MKKMQGITIHKFLAMMMVTILLSISIAPNTVYAAPPNTISFNEDPFYYSYRTTLYDVMTEDFGLITFKATDDPIATPFNSLSWMSGRGMAYAGYYTSTPNWHGLTLSSNGMDFINGIWFVFGTKDRGTKFAFKSMKIGEVHGVFDTVEIVGLRDGVKVASQISTIDTSTKPNKEIIMTSAFEYVDEIRIRQITAGIYDAGYPAFEGIVVNDFVLDAPVIPEVGFDPASYSVGENQGSVTLTVKRTGNVAILLTVDYSTSDGTANAGMDYEARFGTLSFASGEESKTITIPIIDNSTYEGDRTFNIALSNPTNGGILGTQPSATITIVEDEEPDTTPPVWADTYPKTGTITKDAIELLVQTDEAGVAYFVCLPEGASAPSAAQVKAGKDALDNDAAAHLKGSTALEADHESILSATFLTAGKSYDIYLVAEDKENNLQETAVKIQAATASVTDIEIKTLPAKLAYKVGEALDLTGLVVEATYSDGSQEEVAVTSANVTGFDSSTAYPSQTLTITIGGKTADFTISVEYQIYTLTYTTGIGGNIAGNTPQTVIQGAAGTEVTAVPNEGYHFVTWSDGATTASRTDSNVTENINVTATFAINEYTLTYTAGTHGSITGTTPQTVSHGMSGTTVTAVAEPGYHFVSWSDGITTKTRTDIIITGDINVTATFAPDEYTLSYTAGANGSIIGDTPQTVSHGANGTNVTAVPNAGYHFVSWSDGITTASRTDSNVTGNMTVTANFAINEYSLAYTAGVGGSISGDTPQTVSHGANGTNVTAVPDVGYHFVRWSDGKTTANRVDENVTANIHVTAEFAGNPYQVHFESNDGSSIESQTVRYKDKVVKPENPTKSGYDFVGWYKEPAFTNQWDFEEDTVPAEDTTLYAKWIISQESITMLANPNSVKFTEAFDQRFTLNISGDRVKGSINDADLTLGGIFSSLMIEKFDHSDTTVTARVYGELTNTGIGTIILSAEKLENRTSPLTAEVAVQEDPKPTCIVIFKDYDGRELKTEIVECGKDATAPTHPNRKGYTFTGWDKDFGNITDNLTVTAQYSINQYTVSFNSNGGSLVESIKTAYNSKITKPQNPTKKDYSFQGWYKDESWTNLFDFDTPIVENITLYAKWNKTSSGSDSGSESGGSNSSSSGSSEKQNESKEQQGDTIIIVNGQEQKAGEERVTEETGKKIVEIKVHAGTIIKKIEEMINHPNQGTNGEKAVNIVEVSVLTQDAKKVSTVLTGDIVKKMEENAFKLSIKTKDINYVIPAKEIGIESIAHNLGITADRLEEIQVEVIINKADEAFVKKAEEISKLEGCEILFTPVSFELEAKIRTKDGEEKAVAVSKFNQYVQRVMEIPEGIDPTKITTGIAYNEDGTFSHVPTVVFNKDGKYYGKLSSLTNSSYSVISNPIKVASVENHWSKESVNDMASRLVIKNPHTFAPNENITRGEFAEYITKALGIYRTGTAKTKKFSDVEIADEVADAVEIAMEYGIIGGYLDGTFKPEAQISREEAMVMYARAMDVAGLKEINNNRIENYKDKEQIAPWAFNPVKKTISVHVFNGKTNETINPKDTLTYAEAATAIRNLLIASGLINE